MAQSPTIREVQGEVIRLAERFEALKDHITRIDLTRILERLAVLEN